MGINSEGVHYGKKLCELRDEAGLTQDQIAEKVGVTQATVSLWESAPIPPLDGIIRFIDAIGRDLTDLFGRGHLSPEEQELLRLYGRAPEGARDAVMRILRGWKR